MTGLDFHPEAEEEFVAAVDYYESCESGLGSSFAGEVLAAIENILAFPTAWPLIEHEIRRCQTRRFPYGILYTVEADMIFILAVMDLRREPGCWKDRLR